MIRKLVEELEKSQLDVDELRHDIREEKKKNKDSQNLLDELVHAFSILLMTRAIRPKHTRKPWIRNVNHASIP
jgi:hypothetical protein